MPAQLEWRVDDDSVEWNSLEPGSSLPPPWYRCVLRRIPRWVWYVLFAAALAAALGGYLSVRRRYRRAMEQIQFQIQTVIDLEAQAFELRDRELFLEQLDPQSGQWERDQRKRLYEACSDLPPDGASGDEASRRNTPALDTCYPILPARVENLELEQGIALVEVVEAGTGVRRARFYRKTDRGWLHTSPKLDFWQPAVETSYANLTVLGHRRDLPHAGPLLDRISSTAIEVCEVVGCEPDVQLVVEIAARREVGTDFPRYEEGRVRVDSPWLLGIPLEQTLDDEYDARLTHAAVQALVDGALAAGDAAPESTPLQKALVDELTAWYTTGDTSTAPLLGPIIERHGEEALPEVVRAAANARSVDEFLSAWLGGAPDGDDPEQSAAFFQAMLDVEREALLAGRKETFMLFQLLPDSDSARYRPAPQEALYSDVQYVEGLDTLPAIRVTSVEVEEDTARVQLDLSPPVPLFLPPLEFFYWQEDAWKHSMPYYARDYIDALAVKGKKQDQDVATIRFGCPDWQLQTFEGWATQFIEQTSGIRVQVVPIQHLVPYYARDGAEAEVDYRAMSHLDVVLQTGLSSDMVQKGWLYDLRPLIAQDAGFDGEDFFPGLLEQWQGGGATWALPLHAGTSVILFDRDAFDAAGIPYPLAGWTQDEFLAAAKALTERQGGTVSRYGFVDSTGVTFVFVKSRAGSALTRSAAGQTVDLTAPQVVDAVRWYTDLALAHGVMPDPQTLGYDRLDGAYHSAIRRLVDDRQAAMWSDSTYSWTYRDSQFNLGMVPFPVTAQPVNRLHSIQACVMNARTAHLQASWQWMVFLTRQYESHLPPSILSLPVRLSVAESPEFQAQLQPEVAATVRHLLDGARAWSAADPIRPIHDAVQAVYQGASVEEALAGAQASWGE